MIRIIGDRLSWEIKAALLHTIGMLIAKAGPGLKPFVPQLQTTFLKCLADQIRILLMLLLVLALMLLLLLLLLLFLLLLLLLLMLLPLTVDKYTSALADQVVSTHSLSILEYLLLQARQVRQSAAENLGQLTRMSMRVDQLAGDLLTNARQADPTVQEAYLTAVRGMLLTSGQRLSQPVLSRAGETLQSMMAAAG